MNKDNSNHLFRSPLFLQMHQQEIRLRATIEAIRDAYIRQLDELEKQQEFINKFFDDQKLKKCIERLSDWTEQSEPNPPTVFGDSANADHRKRVRKMEEEARESKSLAANRERKCLLGYISSKTSSLKSYLSSLGVDIGDLANHTDVDALFYLRGSMNAWYVKKIDSLKNDFDQSLSRIFDLSKQDIKE